MARILIMLDVEIGRKGIEDLTGIGKVCLQCVDRRMRQRIQIKIEDTVTALEEVWDDMASSFP